MDIGEYERTITVIPLKAPVIAPEPSAPPLPEKAPEKVVPEREKEPA